jgi:hypothetical protein
MSATATAAKITYRKTQQGQWVAFGPASAITAGATVTVSKRDGSTKTERVESVGRPFTANGTQCVYGYLAPSAPRAASRPAQRSGRSMCDECGERRAVTTATDMSGFTGDVCGICARSGALSFA